MKFSRESNFKKEGFLLKIIISPDFSISFLIFKSTFSPEIVLVKVK